MPGGGRMSHERNTVKIAVNGDYRTKRDSSGSGFMALWS